VSGYGYLEARRLTAAETRTLRARANHFRGRGKRASAAGLWAGAVSIAGLWVLTLLASDAPPLAITAFWLVVGRLMILWVRKDLGTDGYNLAAFAERLDSALSRNLAEVFEIR
jgi:hypothetical protein